MTVFLHIGSVKTGTTSIQRFCADNRLLLRQNGYRYPLFMGKQSHQKLAVYAHNLRQHAAAIRLGVNSPETQERFRHDLEAEVEERLVGETDHILLSSEHCSAILNSIPEIARLHTLLSRLNTDIKLIFYARQQADFFVSEYSTNIVTGRTQAMYYPGERHLEYNFNYFAILSRWEQVFGKDAIVGRIFDRKKMRSGNVINDFCETIGLGQALIETAEMPPRLNESLDHETAEFLRRFNERVPSLLEGEINLDRGNIGELLRSISTRERIAIPPDFAKRLREDLYESNCLFRERFVDGIKADPFDWEPRNDALPLNALSIDDAFRVFAELWALKVRETRKAKKK